MKSLKKIILIAILLYCWINSHCLATNRIEIILDKETVQIDEEFKVNINIDTNTISALTLQIYFDTTKLEYVNKTENSNIIQNRVIYTWVDDKLENTEGNSQKQETFNFKAIQKGTANIVLTGEYYDRNGVKLNIQDSNIIVKVDEENSQLELQNENDLNNMIQTHENSISMEEQKSVGDDNTNLKIMRISEVGISPDFQKDIKEYYYTADDSINELEITAIPENNKATVTITGNKNLKQGLNTINIEVESKDKTKKTNYKIYVTKTSNKEIANANLENLAIKDILLYPSFDKNTTEYRVEVSNDIEILDIFAVPEKENSKVEIIGNDKLEIGDNTIYINITAEDGKTKKKYIINAHRRDSEEQIEAEKEQEKQEEQLITILSNEHQEGIEQITQKNNIINETENDSNLLILIISLSVIIITVISIITYYILIKNNRLT